MRRKIYQKETYKSQRQDQEEVKEAKRVFEGTTFVQRIEIEDVEDTTQTGKEKKKERRRGMGTKRVEGKKRDDSMNNIVKRVQRMNRDANCSGDESGERKTMSFDGRSINNTAKDLIFSREGEDPDTR